MRFVLGIGLLERPIVADVIEPKIRTLIPRFGKDVTEVRVMFQKLKDNPPSNKNSPPFAGAVAWVRYILLLRLHIERLLQVFDRTIGGASEEGPSNGRKIPQRTGVSENHPEL